MLALDTDRERAALQDSALATPEVDAQAEQEAAIELSQDGLVPPVVEAQAVEPTSADPSLTASEQAFGDRMSPGVSTAEGRGSIDGGMFHPDEYQTACVAAGTPEKWHDRYFSGHTAARQWDQPYDTSTTMAWKLKPGQSASQAVKDFLAGPTIADYTVISVANEMNELRDTLGDQTFDRLFGSADLGQDAAIAEPQRLQITAEMYTVPFWDRMMEIAAGESIEPADEPEAPAVAAGVEQVQAPVTGAQRPAPEAIAAELSVERDEEFA